MRQTTAGLVEGVIADGVQQYLGVPFAAPPRRFESPQPRAAWSGVRPATRRAPACMQPAVPPMPEGRSEDCLYLNLYAPANTTAGDALPLMLYIHGGGFVSGILDIERGSGGGRERGREGSGGVEIKINVRRYSNGRG